MTYITITGGAKTAQTAAELAETEEETKRAEMEYYANVEYGEAVNAKIRERYTESQEFAILRQRDNKPGEYAVYNAYCEECKAIVKNKKSLP